MTVSQVPCPGREFRVLHVRDNEGDVGIEKFCICPGNVHRLLVNFDAGHRLRPDKGSADGEHPRPAAKVADPFSLDIAFHQGMEEEPGGKRGRGLVLFERCPGPGKPVEALEHHLQVLEFHGISSTV